MARKSQLPEILQQKNRNVLSDVRDGLTYDLAAGIIGMFLHLGIKITFLETHSKMLA